MTKTTDYVGNMIYENNALKRILVNGGYIESGVYYFYLTNHQSNNRVVANASGAAIQKTHYYPFGAAFAENTGRDKQPYKYNGKELDEVHGLNLYDYGARHMEPALGRFTSVDPLAEKYYSVSPYAYCMNNPVKFIDPDGRDIRIYYKDEEGKRREIEYNAGMKYEGSNDFVSSVVNDLNRLAKDDKILENRLNDLITSDNKHYIEETKKGNRNTAESSKKEENNKSTGSLTGYNPYLTENIQGDKRVPRVGLAHELLGHGWDADQGKTDFTKLSNGLPMYEINAINIENIVRDVTDSPLRSSHSNREIPSKLLKKPIK